MRTATKISGIAAITAGLMSLAAPAFADGDQANDGINLLDNTNASVLPVQLCGNNVAVLGLTAPIGSPQHVKCVNAPQEQ